MSEEIRAFALLRNRRERQWKRLHRYRFSSPEILLASFYSKLHAFEIAGLRLKKRLIRRQRQDGVRR